jgi:LacI family transcriptional regulator
LTNQFAADRVKEQRKTFRDIGSRMNVTIKDVARESGLSIATISKYLNGGNVLAENNAKIAGAIEKLGYKVNTLARGLKTKKSMTVGILIPDLKNIFCMTIISSLEDALMQNGYSTIVCDYGQRTDLECEKLNFLVDKQVDGIILMPSGAVLSELESFMNDGIPVVLIDRALEWPRCDTVLADNLNASYSAVERLLTLGHRRIGIICGPDEVFTARERYLGYTRVLGDYGVPVNEELVKKGDYNIDSGFTLFNELMDTPAAPTAIFVTNYEMTLGAVIAANERGIRFPDNLSFIGFDNLQISRVIKPRLTIVTQPMEEIGKTAAGILLKRLKGNTDSYPAMIRLKTSLLAGESTKEYP